MYSKLKNIRNVSITVIGVFIFAILSAFPVSADPTTDSFDISVTLVIDDNPPDVPEQSLPETNYMVYNNDITFDWSKVTDEYSGFSNYKIQVSTDAEFDFINYSASPVDNQVTFDGFLDFAPGTTFYWQVGAEDNARNFSGWSDSWTVYIETITPAIPQLTSPATGYMVVDDEVNFEWGAVVDDYSGLSHYEIQVSTDETFTEVINYSDIIGAGTTEKEFSGFFGFTPGTTFYWRVNAQDNAGNISDWSEVSHCYLENILPDPPLLASPADEYMIYTDTVTFEWTDIAGDVLHSGFSNYIIEVAIDEEFLEVEFSSTPVISTQTFTGFLALEPGATVYWRVATEDKAGNISEWSEVWTAYLDNIPPTVPSSLIIPENNELETETTVIDFRWESSTDEHSGVAGYEVQIASSSSFSTILIAEFTDELEISIDVEGYPPYHFYWRVRARDKAGNWSDPTGSRQFTVNMWPPTTVTLSAVEAYEGESIQLSWNAPYANNNHGGWGDLVDAEYEIWYSTDSEFSSYTSILIPTTTPAGSPNSYTVSELKGFTEYHFQLRTKDYADNVSGWSTKPQRYTSGRPVWDSFTSVSTGSITANWQTINHPDAEYRAIVSTMPNFISVLDTFDWQVGYTWTVSDLVPNTTHYFRIESRVGVDTSPPLDMAVGTLASRPLAPAVEGGSEDDEKGETYYFIEVTLAEDDNPPHTLYAIRRTRPLPSRWLQGDGGTGENPVWKTWDEWHSDEHNLYTDVSAGTEYRFDVRAVNVNGVLTDYSPEGIGLTPMGYPGNINVAMMDNNILRISWDEVADVDSYKIYYATSPDIDSDEFEFLAEIEWFENRYYDHYVEGNVEQMNPVEVDETDSTYVTLEWDEAIPLPSQTQFFRMTSIAAGAESARSPVANGEVDIYVMPVISEYWIYRDGDFVEDVSSDTFITNDTGLAVNTSYYWQVKAVTTQGVDGVLSDPVSGFTRAVPAGQPDVISVNTRDVVFEINEAANPHLTEYAVALTSADWNAARYLQEGGHLGSVPSYRTPLSWQEDAESKALGLLSGQEYRIRMRSRSGSEVYENWGADKVFSTLIATAPVLSSPAETTIDFSIIPVNENHETQYLIAVSTGDSQVKRYVRNDTGFLGTESIYWASTTTWMTGDPGGQMKGLLPNTLYRVRLKSRNLPYTDSVFGYESSTHTLARAPGKLSPAETFTNVTSTSMTVNWGLNGNPPDTEFYLRNITALTSSGWREITSDDDDELEPDKEYSYEVRARNKAGVITDWVHLGTQTTRAAVPEIADLDTGHYGGEDYWVSVHISTDDGNPDRTKYAIFVSFLDGEETGWLQGNGNYGETQVWKTRDEWEDKGSNLHEVNVLPATEYTYTVYARNAESFETGPSEPKSITTIPPAPHITTIAEIDNDFLRIRWNVPGGAEENISYYIVYRATEPDGLPLEIGTTTATDFYDDLDGGKPDQAQGLTAEVLSHTSVELEWDAVECNLTPSATKWYSVRAFTDRIGPLSNELPARVEPVVSGYRIYRDGELIDSVEGRLNTEYTDSSLLPNTSAFYQVKAYSSDGLESEEFSAGQQRWSLAETPGTPDVTGAWSEQHLYHCTVEIDARDNSAVTEYAVTKSTRADGGFEQWWVGEDGLLAAEEYWSTQTVRVNSGLVSSTSYYYKVKARNFDDSETALSDFDMGETPAIPNPENFRVLSGSTTVDSITWAWEDPAGEAEMFRIYCADTHVLQTEVSTETMKWEETELDHNTRYSRYVVGVGEGVESDHSNIDKEWTLMRVPDEINFVINLASITVIAENINNVAEGDSGLNFENETLPDNSGWIQSDEWVSAGLDLNEPYDFRIMGRNHDEIETAFSGSITRYTAVRKPGKPTLLRARVRAFQVIMDENGNPSNTEYSIKVTTDGINYMYVQSGGTLAATAFFTTSAEWGDPVQVADQDNIQPGTLYFVSVNARNEDELETAYSTEESIETETFEPVLSSRWSNQFDYYLHVGINIGWEDEGEWYYVIRTGDNRYLDGNGKTSSSWDGLWETKDWWEAEEIRQSLFDTEPPIEPGKEYSFSIFASTDPVSGDIYESAQASIRALPEPVHNLTVTEVDNSFLRINYNHNDIHVLSYKIYRGTIAVGTASGKQYDDSEVYGSLPSTPSVHGMVDTPERFVISWSSVDAPDPSPLYRYRVTAVNSGGEGPYSLAEYKDRSLSPVISGYRIYRNGVLYKTLGADKRSFVDTDIDASVPSYTYQVRALSSDGTEGPGGEVTLDVQARPRYPHGVQSSVSGGNITVRWAKVTRYTDGSSIDGKVQGYNIYKAASRRGEWIQAGQASAGSTSWTGSYDSSYKYYTVKTLDKNNQESALGMILDVLGEVSFLRQRDGRVVSLSMEKEIAGVLYKDTNEVAKNLGVVTEIKSTDDFIMEFTVDAVDEQGRVVNVSLDRRGIGFLLNVSLDDAPSSSALDRDEKNTALYWFNGVEWVKVGEDEGTSGVGARVRNFGRYGVKYIYPSLSFGVTKIAPRIFSPDSREETVNRFRLYFDNPDNKDVTATIYDMRGREIRQLRPGHGESVIVWDGRDRNDKYVESGPYIYQLEAGGDVETGVFAVAR